MTTRALARSEEASIRESDSLSGRRAPTAPDSDDALAALALEYTTRSVRFLAARPPAAPAVASTDARPTPVEVVLWFHSRIYFKTMRALVGKALTGAGAVDRLEDPRVCAKQTLIAVDRSRAALTQIRGEDVERTALLALLDAIARGIEERFGATRTEIARTNKKPASLLKRAASTETP